MFWRLFNTNSIKRGVRWSKEDIDRLRKMANKGRTTSSISKELGRTEPAVRAKASELSIPLRRAQNTAQKGWFTRRIDELVERVGDLSSFTRTARGREGARLLEKEFDSCRAFLKSLEAYAAQHDIRREQVDFQLALIKEDLEEIGHRLYRRKQTTWSRTLDALNKIIPVFNSILKLLGLIGILQLPLLSPVKLLTEKTA